MSDTANSSILGSSLILAGTAIGAGMLALPLVAASTGLTPVLIIFAITGCFAVYSALLTLEANLAIEPGCNLYTMSSRTLGSVGRVLSTIAPLGLFYAVMTAYLSGGGALFAQFFNVLFPDLPLSFSILAFALFSGVFVFCSTKAVDYVNRLLFAVMIACFLVALIALVPSIEYQNIFHTSETGRLSLMAAIPVIFIAFGYHGGIPSIILYQNTNYHSIPRIFLLATLIPFLVYLTWVISVVGNVPDEVLKAISHSDTATAGLVEALDKQGGGSYLHVALYVFSDFALLTSVLGVALGLFDYLAGLFRRSNSRAHRFQTVLITFVPPTVFAMVYPEGFIAALGYGAVALSILAILLPAAIVFNIRRKPGYSSSYCAPGGQGAIALCFLFGLIVIIAQLISVFS